MGVAPAIAVEPGGSQAGPKRALCAGVEMVVCLFCRGDWQSEQDPISLWTFAQVVRHGSHLHGLGKPCLRSIGLRFDSFCAWFLLVRKSVDDPLVPWKNAGHVHDWRMPGNGNYLSKRETGSILKRPSVDCTWPLEDAACRKGEEEGAESAPSMLMQIGIDE